MTTSDPVVRIAQRIARLEKAARRSGTQPQLGSTAVVDGFTYFLDPETGHSLLTIGLQEDGTIIEARGGIKGFETVSDTGWQNLTLQSSWVPFGGGTFGPVARLINGNELHLAGVVKSGTLGVVAFQLPEEMWPNRLIIRSVASGTAGYSGQINIGTDGNCYLFGNNTYVSLEIGPVLID